jgi:carbon storage regulator CsrA
MLKLTATEHGLVLVHDNGDTVRILFPKNVKVQCALEAPKRVKIFRHEVYETLTEENDHAHDRPHSSVEPN